MTDAQQLAKISNWSGFVFGAAGLVAPRLLRTLYGSGPNSEAETVLRMWGIRLVQNAALGVAISGDDELVERALQILVAANLTDAVTLIASGTTRAVPMRTALQIAASDLVFAGVALAALTN